MEITKVSLTRAHVFNIYVDDPNLVDQSFWPEVVIQAGGTMDINLWRRDQKELASERGLMLRTFRAGSKTEDEVHSARLQFKADELCRLADPGLIEPFGVVEPISSNPGERCWTMTLPSDRPEPRAYTAAKSGEERIVELVRELNQTMLGYPMLVLKTDEHGRSVEVFKPQLVQLS